MEIRLAEPWDEPELRALVRSNVMPGWIRLAYAREPDFFQGIGVEGQFTQVIVVREQGQLAGMATRSVRPLYVNGSPRGIGYLGGLRSFERYRRGTGLHRGFKFLRALHADGRAPAYLTTILEGNDAARQVLTSGRAGLAAYLELGRYDTYAVCLRRGIRRAPQPEGVEVRTGPAAAEMLPEIVAFLQAHGRRRQFFPVVEEEELKSPLYRGLSATDFYVALGADGIHGVAARWHQDSFKQNVVVGYSPAVGVLRPVANLALRLSGYAGMPAPGETLRQWHVALPCIRDDRPEVLAALLSRMFQDATDGSHFCIIGFHERDPLREAIRLWRAFRYRSRVYLAGWDEARALRPQLDPSLVPHLEPSTL